MDTAALAAALDHSELDEGARALVGVAALDPDALQRFPDALPSPLLSAGPSDAVGRTPVWLASLTVQVAAGDHTVHTWVSRVREVIG